MQRIQELIDEEGDNPVSCALEDSTGVQSGPSEQPKLLPCYFFDYMVGTSTGGQYDYAEEGDVTFREHPERQNFTCKVALVSQRKQQQSQVTHLFRSYNHSERFEKEIKEYNPGLLGRSKVQIWQACRATSAAPFYFDSITIGANEFIDGGAGNNNPSNIAWNEALWMSNYLDPFKGKVDALISLGCGEKESIGLFGSPWTLGFLINFIKRAKGEVTNTTIAHNETRGLAQQSGSHYFRFSVRRTESIRTHNDLAGVRLSDFRPQWYSELQKEATPQGSQRKKGNFKPDKYIYASYDTIFDGTAAYYTSGEDNGGVAEEIDKCAALHLRRARDRQSNDPESVE
ncbi:hypothetical protein G7Z17_g700 [Cylindrodendrum hubeiense]|uniref:PNPLA domain-containing protein n=1 Tax=Cylindrodendrum hubeiense TaxID=595255 RepID=A0A9P5LMV7_9HYPO|nr:hypothetical protein G7Z17_g700 [Cylindrodendrum hubeiense]